MTYSDITIQQYEDICYVMSTDYSDFSKSCLILAIIYGLSSEEVLQLPLEDLEAKKEEIKFLYEPLKSKWIPSKFKLNDKVIDLNRELTLKEYSNLTSITGCLKSITGTDDFDAVTGMSILNKYARLQTRDMKRLFLVYYVLSIFNKTLRPSRDFFKSAYKMLNKFRLC